MKFKLTKLPHQPLFAITAAALLGVTATVQAQQGYYQERGSNAQPYISIFEDCDFKGLRRDISVGQFQNMRELDFGNDKMSSIQVPRELEAVIYQHDRFNGDYARVNRDVRCFDQTWNDKVSSLRVEYAPDYVDNRNGRSPVYGGDNRERNSDERNARGRNNGDPYATDRVRLTDGVTPDNVNQVVFDNRVLNKVDEQRWQISDRRKGVSQYREIDRDKTSVYLKNEFNAERVRIDLASNVVTVVGFRGGQNSFNITQRRADVIAGRREPARPATPVKPVEPNRRIASDCFDYVAYTDGGTGGIRFISKPGYQTFQKNAQRGRICHDGVLPMEITKRDKNTNVYVKIQNRVFHFAAGEQEDRFENDWYRKHVKLVVGK